MADRYYIKCDKVCQRKVGITLFVLIAILSIMAILLVSGYLMNILLECF